MGYVMKLAAGKRTNEQLRNCSITSQTGCVTYPSPSNLHKKVLNNKP